MNKSTEELLTAVKDFMRVYFGAEDNPPAYLAGPTARTLLHTYRNWTLEPNEDTRELKKGDRVWIKTQGSNGTISDTNLIRVRDDYGLYHNTKAKNLEYRASNVVYPKSFVWEKGAWLQHATYNPDEYIVVVDNDMAVKIGGKYVGEIRPKNDYDHHGWSYHPDSPVKKELTETRPCP